LIKRKILKMNELTPIQKEIVGALEQMKEKSLITEAVLAKKVRENAKIQGKNKAGICLKDLEICIEYLAENEKLPFSLHLNSANDILIKKVVSDEGADKIQQGSNSSGSTDTTDSSDASDSPSACASGGYKLLEAEAKKRRQSSEKSISVLTSGDLRQKSSGGKSPKKRSDRKKMNFRDIENFD
jgi:antitoxin component of RelBE/YafQ-DinJ toxin-antitoxin module